LKWVTDNEEKTEQKAIEDKDNISPSHRLGYSTETGAGITSEATKQ